MELVLNGEYATRNGHKMKITFINLTAASYPVTAENEKGEPHTYTKSGQFSIGVFDHPYDIIAEWQDEPNAALRERNTVSRESFDKLLPDLSAGPALLNWSETASAGYAPLAAVLQEAYDQAARGKGRDRHDNGEPFVDQRAMSIGRKVGPGFPLGQALKKAEEAATMIGKGQSDAAIRELLGAINYAASAIMLIREQNTGA